MPAIMMLQRRTSLAVALFILASIGVAACQRQPGQGLTDADTAAVRAALQSYLDAATARDASRWAALYAEDAIMMPPNSATVAGRTAIEAWLEALPLVITAADGEALEADGAGDFAYVRGTYSMSMEIQGVPQPIQQQGKLLQIYARQQDGSWLLARDIWNANTPPAAP